MSRGRKPASQGAHALYPGSFDAPTNGHLDLVRRASRIFSHVTVAVAHNIAKRTPMFTVAERVEMIEEETRDLENVTVSSFDGLTVEYARSIGATVIIRGLRAVSDFESELQLAMINDSMAPELTTVFMSPSPRFFFLSSSTVKEMARLGGPIGDFVPPSIERRILAKLGRTA